MAKVIELRLLRAREVLGTIDKMGVMELLLLALSHGPKTSRQLHATFTEMGDGDTYPDILRELVEHQLIEKTAGDDEVILALAKPMIEAMRERPNWKVHLEPSHNSLGEGKASWISTNPHFGSSRPQRLRVNVVL